MTAEELIRAKYARVFASVGGVTYDQYLWLRKREQDEIDAYRASVRAAVARKIQRREKRRKILSNFLKFWGIRYGRKNTHKGTTDQGS